MKPGLPYQTCWQGAVSVAVIVVLFDAAATAKVHGASGGIGEGSSDVHIRLRTGSVRVPHTPAEYDSPAFLLDPRLPPTAVLNPCSSCRSSQVWLRRQLKDADALPCQGSSCSQGQVSTPQSCPGKLAVPVLLHRALLSLLLKVCC